MDSAVVYAKTELGLREIKERRLKLPVPMRGLLIMIDGHRTVADVLEKARALHLDASALEALEVGGLIVKRFSPNATASNDEYIAPRDPAHAQRLAQARDRLAVAINYHLGMRGYALSIRLQKASDARELNEVLRDFATALVRRIGMDGAEPIVAALEAHFPRR